jgi:uncharacterized protein YaaW (UPF0174 family)
MIYEEHDMLTVVQAAALLHLGTAAIREACDRGELPSIPKGIGQRRQHRNISYGALLAWRKAKEQASLQVARDRAYAAVRATSGNGLPASTGSPFLNAKRTIGGGRIRRPDGAFGSGRGEVRNA